MQYEATLVTEPKVVKVSDLQHGEFGIAVDGEKFAGEVFYRTVHDIVGLSGRREWSDVDVEPANGRLRNYVPDFLVRVVQPGESLSIRRKPE